MTYIKKLLVNTSKFKVKVKRKTKYKYKVKLTTFLEQSSFWCKSMFAVKTQFVQAKPDYKIYSKPNPHLMSNFHLSLATKYYS